jgi:hypothetical protein
MLGKVTPKYFLISHVPFDVESLGNPGKLKNPSIILIPSEDKNQFENNLIFVII